MKIALCTSDFFQPIQESIRETGHQVERVYSSVDLNTGFSDKTYEFAKEFGAEFRVGKVEESDLRELETKGVELLITAAYDHKVPTPEDSSIKFMNVHGSLLPDGRGAWPQPWIILQHPEAAGVTFHSMTQEWDRGDIVLQEPIHLAADDHLDSLIGKVLYNAREMSRKLLSNFPQYWSNRRPMEGDGSYWKKPTEEQRTIDLKGATQDALRLHRAFAAFTMYQAPNGEVRCIEKLSGWNAQHLYKPGSLVSANPNTFIYATKDGFLSINPKK